MPDARALLDQLHRNDRIALADAHGLTVADRRFDCVLEANRDAVDRLSEVLDGALRG